MSRFMRHGGRLWYTPTFDPPSWWDAPKGACPHCGGSGAIRESIDEERVEVLVPCPHCQMWCKTCQDWVTRAGHNHDV